MNSEPKRIFDILDRLETLAPKSDLLNKKSAGKWQATSLKTFKENCDKVGFALLNAGYTAGSKIGIMSANCPEWNIVDFGTQQVGMPNVPIYPTVSTDDLCFILKHAALDIIFISEKSVLKRLQQVQPMLLKPLRIISFDDLPGTESFADFLNTGTKYADRAVLQELKSAVRPTDMFTLIYTSGTSGRPKGVMISHENLLSNLQACKDIAPFKTTWRALSFLPLNHIYERFLNVLYLYQGVSIYYAEGVETIGSNAKEIKPHIFVAVPRVLERVLEKISDAGQNLSGFKKRMFDNAMALAAEYELNGKNGLLYEAKRKFYDALVFKKWRAAIGGEMEVIVSGGAALNPRLERIFTCAGLPIIQGYGMTETAVVIAVNRWREKDRMFGTVGIPVENSSVKIVPEDGEICFRGPSVMLGYYQDEEATKVAIDADGWLHTGDVGAIVEGRFLKITDRKKEIFKNSSGKYVAPAAIENKLKESRFIEQSMVVGEGKKIASALIVVSADYARELLVKHNLPVYNSTDWAAQEPVRAAVGAHIKAINELLAPHEQVKRYRLLNGPWTVEGGEITPKLSLRRKAIEQKYADLIAEMQGDKS